jgi:Predicted ATPase
MDVPSFWLFVFFRLPQFGCSSFFVHLISLIGYRGKRSVKSPMPQSASEQEPVAPDQLIRLFRLRPRARGQKKLRQRDLASLIGVETRTLQLWESGKSLPGPDNLQRLIRVLLTEHLFMPEEEEQEARCLWEAGGCGKTRLAQRVGEETLDHYADGVWLVELSTLTDPTLLPGLIATTLALQEQPGHTLLETLVAVLQNKHMLLILDNCEHLVEACARVVEQLHATWAISPGYKESMNRLLTSTSGASHSVRICTATGWISAADGLSSVL